MRMGKPGGIDIIIPVYNAFDDLKACVESVRRHTDLEKHRLFLVNDASSDARIRSFLEASRSKTIIVIENETNLGFSGSINRGIGHSDRDVILLNSDTLVTAGWVEKMVACAYSAREIATVTPLSNNATLCSVPEFLEENRLPEGDSLEEYAGLVEDFSLKLYPRIPVANGFCMYIKREVLRRIGLFDAETFGRGYGEENDFCYRAEQAGYHHVMCDDTYIYHTGTTSFLSEEKKAYILAHEKILRERYPVQNQAVAVHCRDNPNWLIQANLKFWTALNNGRKNLLYLVQADFRKDADDHFGGTQLHVRDLTEVLRREFNVIVAARDQDCLNLTTYIEESEYRFRFYIGKAPDYPEFQSGFFAKLYAKLLDALRIALVHIHHTKDLTLELYYEAGKRGLPVVTTLHDYYTICPGIKLMDYKGAVCDGKPDKNFCAECQKSTVGISKQIEYLSVWQEEQRKALAKSDCLVTPSESARNVILSAYPEFSPMLRVIPHGVKPMKREKGKESEKLHIAFIGGLSREKGAALSCRLIKNGPGDVEWFLFGVWGYSELSLMKKRNYTKTGLYERDDLPGLMVKYQIDVACILPIWPETYCYTLSEAIMCKVPVIATDIGALGERMRAMNCGWLVSVENAYEETLEIIKRIRNKGTEYQEKRDAVARKKLKTAEEMGMDYRELYQEIRKAAVPEYPAEINLRRWLFEHYEPVDGRILWTGGGQYGMAERVRTLEHELSQIRNSFEFKCAKALNMIPFSKKILKSIYFIYLKATGK